MPRRLMLVAVIVALLLGVTVSSRAAPGVPYRDGDTIEFVVPFAPGGGFDVYARLLAPHFAEAIRTLAGVNVNVIVRNMPGAGGQIAHRAVYTARPDGKTLVILHGGAVQNHVLLYNLPIDPGRFTYLAQIDEFVKGIAVRSSVPAKTFTDLVKLSQQTELRVATGGVGDDPHIDPLMIRALMGQKGMDWRIRFVHYEGTGPSKTAILRGDADVLMTTITTLIDIIQSGDARLISVVAPRRYIRFPAVPTLIQEGVPAAAEITDLMYGAHILAGPPGMSPGLTKLLSDAASRAINGAPFRNAASAAQRDVNYLSGPDARARVLAKMERLRPQVDLLKKALGL